MDSSAPEIAIGDVTRLPTNVLCLSDREVYWRVEAGNRIKFEIYFPINPIITRQGDRHLYVLLPRARDLLACSVDNDLV